MNSKENETNISMEELSSRNKSEYEMISSLEGRFIEPEGIAYYLIYSVFSVVGVVSNTFLYQAVTRKMGMFGNRRTFTFLVKVLSILDIILSALIPVDMSLLSFIEFAYKYEYFVHLRNLVLIFESYILILIAVDRYLAMKHPFSELWNCPFLYRITSGLMVLTTGIDLIDLIPKIIMPFFGKGPVFFTYMVCVTVFFLSSVITTSILYVLLYVTHHQYIRSIGDCLVSLRRLQETTTVAPPKSNEQENPLVAEEAHTTAQSAANLTPTKVIIDSRQTPEERILRRIQERGSMKLLCTLAGITLIYNTSIVPYVLAGWFLIPFPGYIILHLFYLNAIANPFIYSLTDVTLRTILFRFFCRRFTNDRN